MSLKVILVPVTGNDTDRIALDAAMTVAGLSNAHIQVLFLHRDPKDVMVPHVGFGLSGGVIDSLIHSAIAQTDIARKIATASYNTWQQETGCREQDDPSLADTATSSFSESIGDIFGNITRFGRLADVICMMRATEETGADQDSLIQAALMETGKPVILLSVDTKMESIKSVAMAWNGSREAARAVSLAMPLLETADSVSVLAATSNDVKPEDVTAFTESLRWHGINANAKMFALNGADLPQQLQDEALKCNAELLILGAYSHSRLREFVLGGVTDDIVNTGHMPVLLAH